MSETGVSFNYSTDHCSGLCSSQAFFVSAKTQEIVKIDFDYAQCDGFGEVGLRADERWINLHFCGSGDLGHATVEARLGEHRLPAAKEYSIRQDRQGRVLKAGGELIANECDGVWAGDGFQSEQLLFCPPAFPLSFALSRTAQEGGALPFFAGPRSRLSALSERTLALR
jgi:hypothetical protein